MAQLKFVADHDKVSYEVSPFVTLPARFKLPDRTSQGRVGSLPRRCLAPVLPALQVTRW